MDAETIYNLAMLTVAIAILTVAIVLKVRQDNAKAAPKKDQVWVSHALTGNAVLCEFKRVSNDVVVIAYDHQWKRANMDGSFFNNEYLFWFFEKPVEEPGKVTEGAYYDYHTAWLVRSTGIYPDGVFYSREEASGYIKDSELKDATLHVVNLIVPKEPAIDPKLCSTHYHSCGTAFVSGTSVKTVTTELPSEVYVVKQGGTTAEDAVALTKDAAKNHLMLRGFQEDSELLTPLADDELGVIARFRKEWMPGATTFRYIHKVPLVTRSET